MNYWDDMRDKYGFGDGGAVPREAWGCRAVYITALNSLAEAMKSKIRVVAHNRGGCHNPCLILLVAASAIKDCRVDPGERVPTLRDWDKTFGKGGEPQPDEAFDKAFAVAMEGRLDDNFVNVKVVVQRRKLDEYLVLKKKDLATKKVRLRKKIRKNPVGPGNKFDKMK